MEVQEAQRRFVRWLETTRNLSPHTIRAYSGDVAALCNYMGPDAPVDDVSGDLIVNFVEVQRAGGLSATSLRRRLTALRSFSRWLIAIGALNSDPWSQMSLQIRRSRKLPRTVPAVEVNRLLDYLCDAAAVPNRIVDKAVFTRPHQAITLVAAALAISTGLRVSEVVGIRCLDLDLADGSIRVTGKGSRERIVFITSTWLKQTMSAHLATRAHLGIDHRYLLFNRVGAPMTPAAMRARIVKAGQEAGLQRRITPHMLRHSAVISPPVYPLRDVKAA